MNKFLSKLFVVLFICLAILSKSNAQTNITVSACNKYILPWELVPTSASGVYSHIYKNVANVDSIVTINLTINIAPTQSILTSTPPAIVNYLINEQFDAGTSGVTYTPPGWSQINKSTTIGTSAWFSGPFLSNGTPSFAPQSGAGCIVADYLNTTGANTISNWLISPMVAMKNGDVLKFYTIQNPGTPYADRMEVRLSTNGASVNVGTGAPTATQVGDFTTVITTINNALQVYQYPQIWTLYTFTISGLSGSGTTDGRIAFRYNVNSGGPAGANSDMIGIDNVTLTRTTNPSICNGNNFNLQVNTIGGTAPFNVVINKNGTNFTTNLYANNTNIIQNPIAATSYSITSITDANGCSPAINDGVITVNINQPIATNFSATACDNYVLPWGITVTTSGTYTNTYLRANGCDSVVTANIIIKSKSTTSNSASACISYVLPWGSSVSTSGIYTNTYVKANGCDSIVNIHVTIKQPVTTSLNISSCDAFILPWSIFSTTVSGTYTHVYTAANGCDSLVSIVLVIKNSTSSTQNITACNSYFLPWDATTAITTSDVYTNVYTAINGCDSVAIINLTINLSDTITKLDTACNSYLLPWNVIATTSGIYTHSYLKSNSCDSIVRYILIIKNSKVSTINISACTSYILPWQTMATTISGMYTHTYNAANGCDSIATIVLNILPIKSTTAIINACLNYTLPWGILITNSGLYNYTYVAANGCDSISNMQVVIHLNKITNSSVSSCNTYTLPWGQIVNASGVFSNHYTTQFGCDSLVNLQVTILPTKSSNFTASTLNSYVLLWGVTVLSSGTYTYNYNASNGCDSTVTAVITILPSVNVALKVLLNGPLNTSTNLMNDDLRLLNVIPNVEPYSLSPYSIAFAHSNGGGGEVIGTNVLTTTGNNAIVDWVFIELRAAANNAIVLATKAALVQRDGDVVSATDGVSAVNFATMPSGVAYNIAIRHRNHAGAMTLNPIMPISNLMTVDFSNPSTPLFNFAGKLGNSSPLTGACKLINGKRSLYAGNVSIHPSFNENKIISYSSLSTSDRTALFNITNGVNTINGYTIFDTDLNGSARFNGLNPDRIIILNNCMNNAIIISQQLP